MSSPLGLLFSHFHARTDSPLRPDWSRNLERRYLRRRLVPSQEFIPMDSEVVQSVTLFCLMEKSPDHAGTPPILPFIEATTSAVVSSANKLGYAYVRNAAKDSVVFNIGRPAQYEFDFSMTFYPRSKKASSIQLRESSLLLVRSAAERHGLRLVQVDIEET